MRSFAVFQAGRFVLMLVGFDVCAGMDAPAANLPVIIAAAELFTFAAAIVTIRKELHGASSGGIRRWMRIHLQFGVKGFLSGVLIELNTRIDILMLGYFTSDTTVGSWPEAKKPSCTRPFAAAAT